VFNFFETSALTGSNVEIMFTALATTIKRKRIVEELEGIDDGDDYKGTVDGADDSILT